MGKFITIKEKLKSVTATHSDKKLELNNVISKLTSHKVTSSLKQLARLLLHGDSRETLYIRTLSGAIFGEINDLSVSATASDFVTALKAVRDVDSLSTFSEPSSFAPASSLKAIIDSITVVTPDGEYSIDDVGKSPGYARAKPALSLKKTIGRVMGGNFALTLNTVSGYLVSKISELDSSSPLSDLISLVKTELGKTTSISEVTISTFIPTPNSTNIRSLVSKLVKKDSFGKIFIDDLPDSRNTDTVSYSSTKEMISNVIDVSDSGFFLKTSLGGLANSLADLGTPTSSEILGLI